jgi:chemotaxis protein CheZ
MNTLHHPGDLNSDVSRLVYQKVGLLTRQLHDSLSELGYTDKLKGSVDKLPDAQSRLSYIARLTGEAAEKVLSRVELAKAQQDHIASETRRIAALVVKDPVAAVAKGEIMNFVSTVEECTRDVDQHLTEIMMAQDFHDLTGQVIARVVELAATIENQLVDLLLQSAPNGAPGTDAVIELAGPVVDPEGRVDVVTNQSQVDDLLASLGF